MTDPASIQHLINAGWQCFEETPKAEPVAEPQPIEKKIKPTVEYPAMPNRKTAITFRGRYMSSIVQAGTVKELKDTLKYIGIDTNNLNKAGMQKALREHIKLVKEQDKGERALASK